jgi:hypothetical protein
MEKVKAGFCHRLFILAKRRKQTITDGTANSDFLVRQKAGYNNRIGKKLSPALFQNPILSAKGFDPVWKMVYRVNANSRMKRFARERKRVADIGKLEMNARIEI